MEAREGGGGGGGEGEGEGGERAHDGLVSVFSLLDLRLALPQGGCSVPRIHAFHAEAKHGARTPKARAADEGGGRPADGCWENEAHLRYAHH